MYAAIYNRSKAHVANVIITKYSINRRVFDLDSSQFEGWCDVDISTGMIFVLCDSYGTKKYSGFMRNIIQDGNSVEFRGEDFRSILNADVLLDYSQGEGASAYNEYYLSNVFTKVKDAVVAGASSIFTLTFSIPSDTTSTSWMGNYDGSYLVVNAAAFLKLYLAYHGYYITTTFDETNKDIEISFVKNTTTLSIKLKDFLFNKTTTDIPVNHSVATIKFKTAVDENNFWADSTSTYWNNQPASNRTSDLNTTSPYDPTIDPNDYSVGFAVRVSNGGLPVTYYYYQVVPQSTPRPTTLPFKHYYLGIDNAIYEDTIASANQIYPVKTRIFEDEYLNKAQYAAITELVNARFVENIWIDHNNSFNPIDLTSVTLYTTVRVYDDSGSYKDLPVAEIEWTETEYRIKLGFKKTFFTEIVSTK